MSIQTKNPKRITGLDSLIFASLIKAKRSLSIKQISQRVGITWATANIHIKKLVELNVLNVEKTIRKSRVHINLQFIEDIRLNKTLSEENMPQLNFLSPIG